MSKLGSCDHCKSDAVVEANGRRGCVEHLDDTFRPIGQQLRVIANLAHGHDVAEALRRSDESAPVGDPLVWQGHGGTKYHREDCSLMSHGAVSWRRSFAAADTSNGLGLEPCKVCRPDAEHATSP